MNENKAQFGIGIAREEIQVVGWYDRLEEARSAASQWENMPRREGIVMIFQKADARKPGASAMRMFDIIN